MLTSKVGKVGKVVICGMKGVGKTSILEQLIYGNITPESEMHSTIEDTYVASVDTGRTPRDTLRLYDTAGLQGNVQLPRYYLQFPEGFILVYNPSDPVSFDIIVGVKNDIDKNKDKKEVFIIIVANVYSQYNRSHSAASQQQTSLNSEINPTLPILQETAKTDVTLNRATSWCERERLRHYTCNAMERASLYEPFISMASRLHPPQTKSSFPQLRQLTQKTSKVDN